MMKEMDIPSEMFRLKGQVDSDSLMVEARALGQAWAAATKETPQIG